MKYLLAALSGFALTLCIFVGGAAFAVTYLTAEEVPVQKPGVDSALILPTGAVKVNTTQQGFERVKTQPAPEPLPHDEAVKPAPRIDDTTTASVTPEPATESNDHVNWCADRYRSYRPENNSYTSYSGDTRECVSPFSDDTISRSSGDSDEEIIYIEASASGADFGYTEDTVTGDLSAQHIRSCFSRYRSYRPEDNTYQPYGGGPREQCQ